jgi:hypothetical protein
VSGLPLGRRAIAAAILLVLTAAAALAANAPVAPHGYPRLAFYGSIRGNGYPFYNAPLDSSLNDTTLNAVSRFEEIILDINPIWPYRPDVVRELRRRNPDAKILAYVVGQDIWNARDVDSLRHYPTRYRRLIDNNDGWLYSKKTKQKYFAGSVNLAKKDGTGRYVIADSLALLWKENSIDPGNKIWDGIFYDILCDDMAWPLLSGDTLDYVRAGYSSFDEFNRGWHAATDTIATLMRNWGGPDFIMVGNCALGSKYSTFNGWMREGFPMQAGGDWYSNMFWSPGGYFTDDKSFMQPRHNYIFSFQVGLDQYSYNNCRIMRLGLGSASLADGFGVFGGQDRDAFHADYHRWWYDEYAVDLATGRASDKRADTGWLGQPLSDFYQMVWVGDQPEGIQNNDFEGNNRVNQWTFHQSNPATLSQDTTTSGHGKSCARIDIPQANPVEWTTNLAAAIQFPLQPYTTYSATFWMKASTPRAIPVIVGVPGLPATFTRDVSVGTEWRQIQVPFTTTDQTGNVSLTFFFAKNAGTVWMDDVHFQQGISTVYRRDFQHGCVLVNPSTDNGADVKMERAFHRILGISDPATNDGSISLHQFVPPSDALFLLGDDVAPPEQVKDLHQVNVGGH